MLQIITTILVAFVLSHELTEAAVEVGWPVTNRAYTDSASGQVFIDKRLDFHFNGKITGWKLYAKAQGTVFLQVWRPQGGDMCTNMLLVGQTEVNVDSSNLGVLTINLAPADQIMVQCGDLIGWNNPAKGVIAADMGSGTQYHCYKYLSPTVGQSYDLDTTIGWGPSRKYSLLAFYEESDIGYGWDLINRPYLDTGSGQVFVDKRFKFPYRGEIIGWKLYTRAAGEIYMQAYRPENLDTCTMTLLRESKVVVPNSNAGLLTVDLDIDKRIEVQKGDMFGWNNVGKGVITTNMWSGNQYHCFKYENPAIPGETYTFDGVIGWGPNRKYSVHAVFQGLLGWPEVHRQNVDTGVGQVFVDKRLEFPEDGIVTGWQLYSRNEGTVLLQIWRPSSFGSCSNMELIGQTKLLINADNKGYLSFDLVGDDRIKIKAGDLVGWYDVSQGVISAEMYGGEQYHCQKYRGVPSVGDKDDLLGLIGWGPNRKYSLSAKFKGCDL